MSESDRSRPPRLRALTGRKHPTGRYGRETEGKVGCFGLESFTCLSKNEEELEGGGGGGGERSLAIVRLVDALVSSARASILHLGALHS